MEKSELTLIKFNGKNYTSWSYQFQVYLEGKEMWGHVSGTDPKPQDDDKKKFYLGILKTPKSKPGYLDLWNLSTYSKSQTV